MNEQGPVTYAFLILHSLFTLSNESITALEKFLELVKEKGLLLYDGKNPLRLQRDLNAVLPCLYACLHLPITSLLSWLRR